MPFAESSTSESQNYINRRAEINASTRIYWQQAQQNLIAYFAADRELKSITVGDPRDWERWLKSGEARKARYGARESEEGLAPNTVRKRVGDAKQFFEDVVSRELLTKNPFDGFKGTVGSNRERFLESDQCRH